MRSLVLCLSALLLLPGFASADKSDPITDQQAMVKASDLGPFLVSMDGCVDPATELRHLGASRDADAMHLTVAVLGGDLPATCGEGTHAWMRSFRATITARMADDSGWIVLDSILRQADGQWTQCLRLTHVGIASSSLACAAIGAPTGDERAWNVPLSGALAWPDGSLQSYDLRGSRILASVFSHARATSLAPGNGDIVYTDAIGSLEV